MGRSTSKVEQPTSSSSVNNNESTVPTKFCCGPFSFIFSLRKHKEPDTTTTSGLDVTLSDLHNVNPKDIPVAEEVVVSNRAEKEKCPIDTDDNGNDTEELVSPTSSIKGFLTAIPMMKGVAESGYITAIQLYNLMNDGHLIANIHDLYALLLIDTRSRIEYDNLHIASARLATFLNNMAERKANLVQYNFVVLYDNVGEEDKLSRELAHLKVRLQDIGLEPLILSGGMREFVQRFPFACTKRFAITESDRRKFIKIYPSVIIEGSLWLGRGAHAVDSEVIRNLMITHIVNVSMEFEEAFPDLCKYFTIRLKDDKDSNILDRLSAASRFIRSALDNGGRVLIHCNLGISRSATVTTAFLMRQGPWDLRDAIDYLRDCRSVIRPNRNFLGQLSAYEQKLFGRKLTDIDVLFS